VTEIRFCEGTRQFGSAGVGWNVAAAAAADGWVDAAYEAGWTDLYFMSGGARTFTYFCSAGLTQSQLSQLLLLLRLAWVSISSPLSHCFEERGTREFKDL
jgi:hypothetical protein